MKNVAKVVMVSLVMLGLVGCGQKRCEKSSDKNTVSHKMEKEYCGK